MRSPLLILLLVAVCMAHQCVHDQFAKNAERHYYDDIAQRRLLQGPNIGPLRIYADYTQVQVNGTTQLAESLVIKRIMNITSNFFYKMLKVDRIPKLFFPSNVTRTCNTLTVPAKYTTSGLDSDLGLIVGSEYNTTAVYLAKSASCAFLSSNSRPIWGAIVFNLFRVRNDQEGFQEQVYIALHEITHILAFSSTLYTSYPKGNPLVGDLFGQNLLSSPEINREVQAHFGCADKKGLELEDQDASIVSSHWEFHNVGSEYMIAQNQKQSRVSRFTAALFESTGWYYEVDYSMTDSSTWGKGKGCAFKNIDNCDFDEFCTGKNFACDWDYTGIGRCSTTSLSGTCQVYDYFGNTICIDENYEVKNLNAALYASERGGPYSRCVDSDYRQAGLAANKLNNRCYLSVCSLTNNAVYYVIQTYIFVCTTPGTVYPALPGFDGTLTCTSSFERMCTQKQTCINQCSRNGICIAGQCLCFNTLSYSAFCPEIPLLNEDNSEQINLQGGGRSLFAVNKPKKSLRSYDMDAQCSAGSIFDPIVQSCVSCQELLGCSKCDKNGCLDCEDGREPRDGNCFIK